MVLQVRDCVHGKRINCKLRHTACDAKTAWCRGFYPLTLQVGFSNHNYNKFDFSDACGYSRHTMRRLPGRTANPKKSIDYNILFDDLGATGTIQSGARPSSADRRKYECFVQAKLRSQPHRPKIITGRWCSRTAPDPSLRRVQAQQTAGQGAARLTRTEQTWTKETPWVS